MMFNRNKVHDPADTDFIQPSPLQDTVPKSTAFSGAVNNYVEFHLKSGKYFKAELTSLENVRTNLRYAQDKIIEVEDLNGQTYFIPFDNLDYIFVKTDKDKEHD